MHRASMSERSPPVQGSSSSAPTSANNRQGDPNQQHYQQHHQSLRIFTGSDSVMGGVGTGVLPPDTPTTAISSNSPVFDPSASVSAPNATGSASPTGSGGAGNTMSTVASVLQREQLQYTTTLQRIPSFRETHDPPPPPHRHRQFVARSAWSTGDNSKTNHGCLALCLGNVGWEEGSREDVRPGLPRVYCWRQPKSLAETAMKAVERLGSALEAQYDKHRRGVNLRLSLNPTIDELKDHIHRLRRAAGTDKVLFHYCGHSCLNRERDNATVPLPRPERNYFFVLSNKGTPVPFSVDDLLGVIGFPHILVFDCASAGSVLNHLTELMRKEEQAQNQRLRASPSASDLSSLIRGDCFFLGACAAGEALPSHPLLPNDLFTSCITTPIQMSILWFIIQHQQYAALHPMLTHCIPGMLEDRKTPLGELKWIFVAITDCIAWSTVSQDLFFRLFRQDLFLVALFRGFLLAERIGINLGCTPQSFPRIPSSASHPLWETWDCVLDSALSAVVRQLRPMPTAGLSLNELRTSIDIMGIPRSVKDQISATSGLPPSSFFKDELKSFHAMLHELERDPMAQPHIPRLAVVPHALCSLANRRDGMLVLARLVDRGIWAVDQCEQVRIYNEVLNRLWSNTVVELRELMVFVFCKSVFVDPLLVPHERRAEAIPYLAEIVRHPTNSGRLGIFSTAPCQQLLAISTIVLMGYNSVATLELCMKEGLMEVCADLIETLGNGGAASPQQAAAGSSSAKSASEEHYTTLLKVSLCAMVTVLMYCGEQAVAMVGASVIQPVSMFLADPSAKVRRATLRVLQTYITAASVKSDKREYVMRLVMSHARIEGNVAVRIEIINCLYRASVRNAAILTRISSDDLKKVLTPTLNANRRDSVTLSEISPVSLPPALQLGLSATSDHAGGGGGMPHLYPHHFMHQQHQLNQSTSIKYDDDEQPSDSSPNVQSPQMSPFAYSTLLTPHSASNPWYAVHKWSSTGATASGEPALDSASGGNLLNALSSTASSAQHSSETTSNATPLAAGGTAAAQQGDSENSNNRSSGARHPSSQQQQQQYSNEVSITMASVHMLAVFSVDFHIRVRAHGCKAIQELASIGNIPFQIQTRPQENFTPKQSNFDRMVSNFFRKGTSAGDTGGGGRGGGDKQNSSLPEGELAVPPMDIDDLDVTLKEIILEDLSTVADFVQESFSFLSKPLLVASADSDPRNPVNKRFRNAVDSHLRATSIMMSNTLSSSALSNGFVTKSTADTDAKSIVFHPTDNHLITGNASDQIAVWRYEEPSSGNKEKELKCINGFRLSNLMSKTALLNANGGAAGSGDGSSMGPSSSSGPMTPKTPTSTSSRAHFGVSNSALSATANIPLRCQVSSMAIVDAVHQPLLATATADGSITLLSHYTSPGHTRVVTTFKTMVHEHAVHSHHCSLAYQPLVQHVHVTGWMGFVSTWDLATEMMVAERRESSTAATCVASHHSSPMCFTAGFTSGMALLFDIRSQRGVVHKLEGLKSSVLNVCLSKSSTHLLTAVASNGMVMTWDERKIGGQSASSLATNSPIPNAPPSATTPVHQPPPPAAPTNRGTHLESYALIQQSFKGKRSAASGYGLEHLTAVDIHPCSGVKPVSLCGSGGKVRVFQGSSSVKKVAHRAQVQCCSWHTNRFMGAYSVGGKVTILDQPVICDVVVAGDVFDF